MTKLTCYLSIRLEYIKYIVELYDHKKLCGSVYFNDGTRFDFYKINEKHFKELHESFKKYLDYRRKEWEND